MSDSRALPPECDRARDFQAENLAVMPPRSIRQTNNPSALRPPHDHRSAGLVSMRTVDEVPQRTSLRLQGGPLILSDKDNDRLETTAALDIYNDHILSLNHSLQA